MPRGFDVLFSDVIVPRCFSYIVIHPVAASVVKSRFPFYDVTSIATFPVRRGSARSGIHMCTVHKCPRELYPRWLVFVLVNVSDVTRFHNVLVSSSRRELEGAACLIHKSPHGRVTTILFSTRDYNNQKNVGTGDIKKKAILVFTTKLAIL